MREITVTKNIHVYFLVPTGMRLLGILKVCAVPLDIGHANFDVFITMFGYYTEQARERESTREDNETTTPPFIYVMYMDGYMTLLCICRRTGNENERYNDHFTTTTNGMGVLARHNHHHLQHIKVCLHRILALSLSNEG